MASQFFLRAFGMLSFIDWAEYYFSKWSILIRKLKVNICLVFDVEDNLHVPDRLDKIIWFFGIFSIFEFIQGASNEWQTCTGTQTPIARRLKWIIYAI